MAIFSKQDLDINPLAPGAGLTQPVPEATQRTFAKTGHACTVVRVHKLPTGAYPFVYRGFTLLLQSGGNLFLTPTPTSPPEPWDPVNDYVFVIPYNENIRIELARGADYVRNPVAETAGPHPVFAC